MKKTEKYTIEEIITALKPDSIPQTLSLSKKMEISMLQNEILLDCLRDWMNDPEMAPKCRATLKKIGWLK